MKYNNIFFDLDGTLTDSGEGIMNSVRYALKKFDIEETDDDNLRRFIGPPLIDCFIKYYGFDHEQAVKAVEYYREYFAPKGIYENHPYDGIREMMAALRSEGKRLYLATSKPEPFAKEIVRYFGLDEYLEGIFGSTMSEKRTKKDEVIAYALTETELDPKNVVMVGDRNHDVLGAKTNGVYSVGVLFGYGSREELEEAGANTIVETVNDLRNLLSGGN